MGRTHALLGVASLWLLQPLPGVLTPDTAPPLAIAATFGALLPDLDAAGSTIKYLQVGGVMPFMPLSGLLHRAFGHRGLLHSGWGLAAYVLLCEVAQSAPLLAAGMNGLEEGTDSMSVSSSEVLEVGGGSMPPSTSCRGR